MTHTPTSSVEEQIDARSHQDVANDVDRMMDSAESYTQELNEKESRAQLNLSFVIPVKNEEETIETLCTQIAENLPDGHTHEVILIDDGSTDSSWNVIERLSKESPETIRGLRFRCNVGKAAALSAGFRATKGEFVFTMDADLQDDATEIKSFLNKVDEGFDLVSGWKKSRHDPWHKVLPSRVFNRMTSLVTGVKLHDHNCGFKCYRGELAREITLHGELHRMVPAIASQRGYRVAEIEVKHHPRKHGVSKYGLERFLRGFSDMLTIGFLKRFGQRPAHFINTIAFLYLGLGTVLSIAGIITGLSSAAGICVFLCGVILAAISGTVFSVGLMSELSLRGGLPTTWYLPISQDTAVKQGDRRKSHIDRRVSTTYSSMN